MPAIGIADKTTLDNVNAKVGTANPASGDLTTLFKGLKLIADYVDTLEAIVGSNADASSAAGSVHAKLKDVKAAVTAIKPLPTGTLQWGGTGTSEKANTVLNISGAGWLISISPGGNYDSPATVSVQADGGTVRSWASPSFAYLPVRFTSSLLVKCSAASGAMALAILD